MAVCRKDDTLNPPMYRVNDVLKSWVKKKMRADGRLPNTEYIKHSRDISKIAGEKEHFE